jgi:hypothetical protein
MGVDSPEPPAYGGNASDLDRLFGAVHESWVEEAGRVLAPFLEPNAPRHEVPTVIRYLHERFIQDYRSELELVEELGPFVSAEEMARLRSGSEELQRICRELDRVEDGQHAAERVAELARELLARLQFWCAPKRPTAPP